MALLCTSYSDLIKAQIVENTTGNLITGTWTGAPSSTTPVQGFSGGSTPTYNTSTNTIQFGYTQRTVSQNIAINAALAAAGTGVQLTGFNYSWSYYNQEMNRGTLTGNISLTSSAGATLQTYNYVLPQTVSGWTSVSGVQSFASPYAVSGLNNLTVSFTGKDDRFWAGYYGPLVKDIDVRLRYGVDPCANNPAYSPACPGFSNIVETSNMVPNAGAVSTWGSFVNNSFAINSAFQNAGNGLQVHGFKYGFNASANDYCALTIIFCFDNRTPWASVSVSITDKNNSVLYSNSYSVNNANNSYNYTYLFNRSETLGNLKNFNMTATTGDNAVVSNMYAKVLYTPDICTIDPQNNPSCPNYFKKSTSVSSEPVVEAPVVQPTATVTSSPVQTSSAVVETQSTSPTTTQSSNTSVSTTSNSTNQVSSSNNNQTKAGEVTIAGQTSSTRAVSLDLILNIIGSEQSRLSKLEMSTASAAVNEAKQEAEKAVSEALQVSATQQAQTLTNNDILVSSQTAMAQTLAQSSIQQVQVQLQPQLQVQPQQPVTPMNTTSASASQSLGSGIQVAAATPLISFRSTTAATTPTEEQRPNTVQSITQVQTFTSTPTISSTNIEKQESDNSRQQVLESSSNLASWSPTNPINNILTPQINLSAPTTPAPSSTVNRNVQPNQAAGESDISSYTASPAGFDAYTQLALRDGAFYKPYEVYKGQVNVDNARALRQLSSDRLHQQLIDQQYNR